jgi:prepilin-type N-terminal cleavage/methylation domain-containing protein
MFGNKNTMKKTFNNIVNRKAFSLAEVLVALTIGAMVLVAVMAVYNRAQSAAAAISRHLDSERLTSEVLQRIAEDLDGIIDAGKNVKITIQNKWESHGLHTARLEILKNVYDDQQKPQVFEKIIWQGNFDYDGGSGGLVLYRSHSGIAYEDKLLEQDREDWQRELFVPVCSGVTYFAVEIPQGDQFQDSWTAESLPAGVVITISFAEPVKDASGVLDVPYFDKIRRTVAIDRTRKMRFVYEPPQFEDVNQPPEPNEPKQEPNEPNKPVVP